jgi:hypothetical protein
LVLVLTPAIEAPREVEAKSVWAFTLVVTPPMANASDDEAAFVFALIATCEAVIAEARLVEAFVTSDCTAREPTESPAPVKVRVPNDQTWEAVRLDPPLASVIPIVPALVRVEVATFQTSEASVPKVVRERVPADQTAVGMVEASDVEAVRTVESVWVLMVLIAVVN